MGCFQVRYDSRVVIYERKLFTRLATGKRIQRAHNHTYKLIDCHIELIRKQIVL